MLMDELLAVIPSHIRMGRLEVANREHVRNFLTLRANTFSWSS